MESSAKMSKSFLAEQLEEETDTEDWVTEVHQENGPLL